MSRRGWLGKATIRAKRGMPAKMRALKAAEKSALAAHAAALPPPVAVAMRVRPADIAGLLARMRSLPAKVQNTVMAVAADKAMEPMVRAARAGVPARTGLLRRAIGKKRAIYQKGRIVDVLVGVRKDVKTEKDFPAKYAHLVEFGTAPHQIKPHAVKMSLGAFSGWIWVTSHPGSRPRPFLRPAFDSTRAAVAENFKDRVLFGIEDVCKGFGV